MRKIIFIAISLTLVIAANAQSKSRTPQNSKNMPESESTAPLEDKAIVKRELEQLNAVSAQTFKITEPVMLSIYKPNAAIDKHIGVIVCPGGGYRMHLFLDVTRLSTFLIKQGFTPMILEYRLPAGNKNIPFDDLKAAFSMIKLNADKWAVSPEKIGILGTSAGGHMATMASSEKFAKEIATTLLFAVLAYPAITMTDPTTYSVKALLGNNPPERDVMNFSAELQVTPHTPPTIILTGWADEVVSPKHTLLYGETLLKNNVSSAVYLLPEGKHGFFADEDYSYNDLAFSLLKKWLKCFTE